MNHVPPVLPGETLAGKYRVERVLGRGGMGLVVAARHLALDERVAIKFLLAERQGAGIDRFLREARAAAKIRSEHVCRVFDFGRTDTGEPYIVMEHLEGTDLAQRLEREGPQAVDAVVGWVIESCDALATAHALGIVHRDLKPGNVFLAARPDGTTCAKLLDFGISKVGLGETLTGPQATMGSPLYMSPEQIESARDVDARADIWSLGIVLYELLTGKAPFTGETMIQLAVAVREHEPAPIRSFSPEVPEALVAVIAKCLAKTPAGRWQTVAELAGALRPFAPDHLLGLVSRLERRVSLPPASAGSNALPERSVALDDTAEDDRPAVASRGTFAPLQSTLADGGRPRATERRRRRLPVALLMFLATVVALAGAILATRERRTPNALDGALPSATEPLAVRNEPTSRADAPPASAASSVAPFASEAKLPLPAPVARPPARATAVRPDVTPAPSASPSVPISAAVGPATPLPAATPTAPANGHKARPLDRADP